MFVDRFALKIAVLGNVSAGKTTVLNALFRDKYGEVGNLRTTAGINIFRLCRQETSSLAKPAVVLEEITNDNNLLRGCSEVKSKTFEIFVGDDYCVMRPDSVLEFIDIPGVNEYGMAKEYKSWVTVNWHTFDCVIVVMDGGQGVNTEEQVGIFHFVKANLEEKKDVPVVIVCNKVDDPHSEDHQEILPEIRAKVEQIFGVPPDALQRILEGQPRDPRMFPVLVPMSAQQAFIYRAASKMTLDQFRGFDKKLVDKLGIGQVGPIKWHKLSQKEKYETAYEIISNQDNLQAGISNSNFPTFLQVLAHSIGGDQVQRELISKQLDDALRSVSLEEKIAKQLLTVYEKGKSLRDPGDRQSVSDRDEQVKETFWRVYPQCEDAAFQHLTLPTGVDRLSEPVEELMLYFDLACQAGWEQEKDAIADQLRALVRRQVGVILEQERAWRQSLGSEAWTPSRAQGQITWKGLSPHDWSKLAGSILLVCQNRFFYESFGKEKVLLEGLVHRAYTDSFGQVPRDRCPACPTKTLNSEGLCESCSVAFLEPGTWSGMCPYCVGEELNPQGKCLGCDVTFREHPNLCACVQEDFVKEKGRLEPVDPLKYKLVVHIDVPNSLSSPKHYGHLAWSYCNFMAAEYQAMVKDFEREKTAKDFELQCIGIQRNNDDANRIICDLNAKVAALQQKLEVAKAGDGGGGGDTYKPTDPVNDYPLE